MHLKNPSEEGIYKSLDYFHRGYAGSPGIGSIEQNRLHDGVKDPDLSAAKG